jgi:radical SAM protein with 4Fe4S-binding SPASM domain
VKVATPPLPKELQVEVTGACNLACRMCLVRYRPKLGKREGAMCFHTFKSIVDELPHLEKVTLQGLGEPLLAPDLFRMIEYAAERGIRMGFNTNGTLLTPDASERLVRVGLDWLHVSLDGASAETYEDVRHGSNFARVRQNVIGLVRARRRLGSERPRIMLVFVAMRRNVGELPALVRLASEWGVGALWVQNLSHSFDDTNPSGSYRDIREYAEREALWGEGDRAEIERIFGEAVTLGDELGVELRLPRLEEPVRAPRRQGQPGCHWPFESAYVTHDGKVQPCCMVMGSDRSVLGDVKAQRFRAIWRGTEYADFRSGLVGDAEPPDVCRGCSLYRGLF